MGEIIRRAKNINSKIGTWRRKIPLVIFLFAVFSSSNVFAGDHGNSIGGTLNSVTISNPISFELVPTNGGTMGISSTNVTVATDAPNGYKLIMSGAYGESDGFVPLYKDGIISSSAPRIASIATTGALTNNTWGYSTANYSAYLNNQYVNGEIASLSFSGVNTAGSVIKTTNSANTAGDTTPVYIGARVDSSMPVGLYNNTLDFTSVVEPGYRDNGLLTVSPIAGEVGSVITLTTDYTNALSAVSASDVSVSLFRSLEHENIADCSSISIDATDNGASGKPLKLTCIIPESEITYLDHNETYGVTVAVWDSGASKHLYYWKDNAYTVSTMYNYTVSYNPNGGSGTIASNTGTETIGYTITFAAPSGSGFSRSYYDFLGWDTNPSATTPSIKSGSSIFVSASDRTKTLYAIWKRQTYSYKVNYNANGGTGTPSATTGTGDVGAAKSITLSSTRPSRNGYTFLGWAADANAKSATWLAGGSYSLGTPTSTSTINRTVYAVWKANGIADGMLYEDVTATMCANTPLYANSGETYTILLDSMPMSEELKVRRLADGKCWLVEDYSQMGWMGVDECEYGNWVAPTVSDFTALKNAGLTSSDWWAESGSYDSWWATNEYSSSRGYVLKYNPNGGSFSIDSEYKTEGIGIRCFVPSS